jgi:hypothetical protein
MQTEAMQAQKNFPVVEDPTAPLGSKTEQANTNGISAIPDMITRAMPPFPNRCCQ